jgi:serine protease
LLSTARPFPVSPDHAIGAGIIDAYAAVLQAAGGNGGGGGGGGNDGSAAVLLGNGTPVLGNGASAGGALFYKVVVPAGARALVLRTFGGAGDVSLYVSRDAVPTVTTHDYASVHVGNNESVVNARPAAGTYYLLVTDAQGLGNFQVNVQASFSP